MKLNSALMVYSMLQKFLLRIRTVPVIIAGLNSNVQMDSMSNTILTISKLIIIRDVALQILCILPVKINHSDGVVKLQIILTGNIRF